MPLTPPTSYRLTTANARTAPGVLRDLVASLLRSTGHAALAESARLCTSELVTNVYQHTRTPDIHMEVTVSDASVTVTVRDDLPGVPTLCRAGAEAERGRGLLLVDACADRWGTTTVHGGPGPASKTVFFRMDTGGRGSA
ncbi:ATP-binding protein [Streptomyces sp. NPDC093252]|uniref:ATP-binding protein n=1 Tax=Streptomyces sp. NPDC093252 TaxID=3154980 RepID=UPI00342609C6